LRLNGFYAVIPAIIYFIVNLYTKIKIKHLHEIEKKFPFLNEELRTAADNMNEDNPVVHELQQDVLEKIRKVQISAFFNSRDTSYKILTSIALCFGILMVATFNISFDFQVMVDNIPDYVYVGGGDKGDPGTEQGDVRTAGEGATDELFGEEDLASLGDEELELELKQSGFEINLEDVRKPRRRYFQDLYPDEICVNDRSCRQSEPYGDSLTEEQSEIVKNYFLKITS
jgi:hypothetical protein